MKEYWIELFLWIVLWIVLLWIAIGLLLLPVGCAVTNYRQTLPDKSEVFIWQGQVLFPSKHKNVKLQLPNGVVIYIGESELYTTPEILKAGGEAGKNMLEGAGGAVGTAAGAFVKP